MVAYGEENRDWGGAFGVYRGLTEALPYHRLFNSPISEAAIVGTAVGYALSGGRAVAELMYCDFMGRAGDEIFNQMAKWQSMCGGVLKMPLVLRVSVGSKYGAQHSQDWTSMVRAHPRPESHVPGHALRRQGHAEPGAARHRPGGLLREPAALSRTGDAGRRAACRSDYYEVPMGEPAVRRVGSDVTIVTLGATLYRALEAAAELEKLGVSAEVIDARFLNPLNYAPIIESVRKTGKCVLASDACERGSFLHTMASNITQRLRLSGWPGGRGRRAQLDHPAHRDGGDVLPANGMDHRHAARTHCANPGLLSEWLTHDGRYAADGALGI